jgi:phosphatidylinositol alpha-mannosyltransferase
VTEGSGGGGPLRVALVCPYSLSRPGGVQGQVLGLARALARRGHRVRVFAPLDRDQDRPADVDTVATGRTVPLRANGSVAPVAASPSAALRALAALREWDADVVHVHEPFAPGLPYGLLLARGLPPVVATFHRSGSSVLYTLLGPLARRLAARIAVRCAVSEAAAATARGALGGHYEVLFNGIELDRYSGVEPWPTSAPAVLFLGRHEERKGLAVLLDAWRGVVGGGAVAGRADGPAVLWVAGDGPETARLRRLHPESDRLRWLGVVDDEEKVRRLVGAEVLAAPSLGGESFGLVLVEAMAARTVVVASDIEGYRQAAGPCAVLVPAGDPTALAAALRGVLAGDRATSRGGAAPGRGSWLDEGADRAARWSMASLAGRYEERYRTVVGHRP